MSNPQTHPDAPTAHFGDRLTDACDARGSRICVGIDPDPARLPPEVLGDTGDDPRRTVDAIHAFVVGVLDAVAEAAPAVKFQSAYFERFHADGVGAYFDLVAEAKSKGLLVIGDAKRGDIGDTSRAYAEAHLRPHPAEPESATPDALTVNPMLGPDTLDPFVEAASRYGKGLFVLVRTSNPGGVTFQDLQLADGRTWSQAVADTLHGLATRHVGYRDYSLVGAVVGATQPQAMADLRQRLPQSVFLLPGYGAQGATAEMTRAAFHPDGRGAIVSASRSVLYPRRETGQDWKSAVAAAADRMRDDVNRVIMPG